MLIQQQNGNVHRQIQQKHWHISPQEHLSASKVSSQEPQYKT